MYLRELSMLGKAVADENRLRVLAALEGRELCLCQIVELLGLATSTVSRHMAVLHQARLVAVRKAGRWAFFRLADTDVPPQVRRIRELLTELLRHDPQIQEDAARLRALLAIGPGELCRRKHAAQRSAAEQPATKSRTKP